MVSEINPCSWAHDDMPPSGTEWTKFNSQWWLTDKGDMCAMGCYEIAAERLGEPSWMLHMFGKNWFDANCFLPAYFEACKRAKIDEVTVWTHY